MFQYWKFIQNKTTDEPVTFSSLYFSVNGICPSFGTVVDLTAAFDSVGTLTTDHYPIGYYRYAMTMCKLCLKKITKLISPLIIDDQHKLCHRFPNLNVLTSKIELSNVLRIDFFKQVVRSFSKVLVKNAWLFAAQLYRNTYTTLPKSIRFTQQT